MIKYLLILLTICFFLTGNAWAQSSNESENQFEAELRQLEDHEESAMNRVESLSKQDTITDSVSVGNAAISKPAPITQESESIMPKKTRRIRSR